MDVDLAKVVESLRPLAAGKIMDMVAQSGIDVSYWSQKKDGGTVKVPAANPSYCFDWAFGGGDQPTALCIWHRSLKVDGQRIYYQDSLRERALQLDVIAINKSNVYNMRSRARDQAKRARNFDLLVQRAFRRSQPVRAILLDGKQKTDWNSGVDSSEVDYRVLDASEWHVESYSDNDGTFCLVRGTKNVKSVSINEPPVYEDQFSEPELPEKRDTSGTVYLRSEAVRVIVLNRAAGICEYCGELGFTTSNGATYLETHHVIPLSERGPDIEWNVVAICPNDHRKAHFSKDKNLIRESLISRLSKIYPIAATELLKLSQSK